MNFFGRNSMQAQNAMGGLSMDLDGVSWDYGRGDFVQIPPNNIDVIGNMFYTSTYKCPMCGKHMYKANVGEYVWVYTPHGKHPLRSTFACFSCRRMYSALPDHRLSEGEYYTLKSRNGFDKAVDAIQMYGVPVQR